MMPDSLSDKIFHKSIINPKTLIVLANSGSPEIRACVIQVRNNLKDSFGLNKAGTCDYGADLLAGYEFKTGLCNMT